MAHLNFDQQLSEAVQLDSTLNLTSSVSRMSLKPISRLNLSSGIGLNRSRSASRVSPTLLSTKPKQFNRSKSPARSKTPTRLGLPEVYNKKSQSGADRFIPNRSTTDIEFSSFLVNSEEDTDNLSTLQLERRRLLEENLNVGNIAESRILSFKSKAPAAKDGHANNMKILYSAGKAQAPKATNTRQVPTSAEKILDAPEMMDDFYLHLIDWSSLNHMAVALSGGLYVWNATDGSILQLLEDDSQYISSVKWIKEGNVLAVGFSEGCVQLWDVAKTKIIRSMHGHTGRIATLDWNQHILASGGREGDIHLHDVRIAEHHVATLQGHSQEVCGLAWSPDGKVLASGGNDNSVQLWEPSASTRPTHNITDHQSAVKAVSWCPWQRGVLATAGGTVDRTIRIWNTTNMNQLHSMDTGSQVSSIVWNSEYRELISGHGFSQNQLTVWKYPSLAKVADLTGHTSRILLLVSSPDSSSVASVAADETIRLWNVWPLQDKVKKVQAKSGRSHPVSLLAQSIR